MLQGQGAPNMATNLTGQQRRPLALPDLPTQRRFDRLPEAIVLKTTELVMAVETVGFRLRPDRRYGDAGVTCGYGGLRPAA